MKETVADYILDEKDLGRKIEIMYYLKKKTGIFFDNTIVYKAFLTKLFIDVMELDVDENLVVTAMLLCECKKVNNAQNINQIESYAKEGAVYLKHLGFNDDFCQICEQHNRYSNNIPRKKESDILELADQFGGMMLDRPERIAFPIEEAFALLENRNLKGIHNEYLSKFRDFINIAKEVNI